jgi:hypothetical protein
MKKQRITKAALAVVLSVVIVGCNAAAIQQYINLAIQIALQVAQLAGASPLLAQKVSGDLGAANKFYNDMRAAGSAAQPGIAAQADAMFTAAEADLQLIFTSANINDPKVQAAVRASLAIAVTAIESARAIALANAPAPVVVALKTSVRVVPIVGLVVPSDKRLKPDQLKSLYNHTVSAFPAAQIK